MLHHSIRHLMGSPHYYHPPVLHPPHVPYHTPHPPVIHHVHSLHTHHHVPRAATVTTTAITTIEQRTMRQRRSSTITRERRSMFIDVFATIDEQRTKLVKKVRRPPRNTARVMPPGPSRSCALRTAGLLRMVCRRAAASVIRTSIT